MTLEVPRHDHSRRSRRFAFLVSTTSCARSIQANMGAASYSYFFALQALAPVLEQFGTWRLIERPESSLTFAAAQASAQGFRPVHLAINPPQDCYLSPALPTILFPFWEFPDLPDRDLGSDPRQNWIRTCRHVSLAMVACRFTAAAFERAGVPFPVAVVPVPLDPALFELPPWDPQFTWSLTCRHEVWGGGPRSDCIGTRDGVVRISDVPKAQPIRKKRVARFGYSLLARCVGEGNAGELVKLKRRIADTPGKSPAKVAFVVARAGYKRYLRPWLSEKAAARLNKAKGRLLERIGLSRDRPIDPPLPSAPLEVGGLVYTTMFGVGDKRKNHRDLLSAFLYAFKDRADVTLVIKLVTATHREHHETSVLRDSYRQLNIQHQCRVVVITEYLDDSQMRDLLRATTFYVNASHAEGACLPLQQALAGGRPAIAPGHTAMADYMDEAVGFVVRSHREPACWPQDPRGALRTTWYRLVWSDLRIAFEESARLVAKGATGYHAVAESARTRMLAHASRDEVAKALRKALALLPNQEHGAYAWAS
jgi:glycosyltransferase involved in cell wall biosynthesis